MQGGPKTQKQNKDQNITDACTRSTRYFREKMEKDMDGEDGGHYDDDELPGKKFRV
ncbi:hypothetical protein C1H46_021091 [Malus baccata]|uniref:Uncharacterized protein n=1 Tax=Malus baccata TaxID=106549 RepID=A0A540M3L3_MALBA|nr:hypothetical protein C1H46_021091 [Malus baccata]